jgi:ketosteroid isomerase-like protein
MLVPDRRSELTLTRGEVLALIGGLIEAYNAKDVGRLGDFYHPDARYWSALEGWVDGLPAIRAHIEHLHDLLPDEQMAIS